MSLTKLFPARESLVSDIPVGDGKMAKLFLQCDLAHFEFGLVRSKCEVVFVFWTSIFLQNSAEPVFVNV